MEPEDDNTWVCLLPHPCFMQHLCAPLPAPLFPLCTRLAGWQPIVYSKTAARLLKAAWCLLRIATPCAVLRRLTEMAVRPAALCTPLPPYSEQASLRLRRSGGGDRIILNWRRVGLPIILNGPFFFFFLWAWWGIYMP